MGSQSSRFGYRDLCGSCHITFAYWAMAEIHDRRSAGLRLQVYYLSGGRMCTGDLVFIRGRPMLVISWRTLDWKRVPYICFSLDEERLKPGTRPSVYVYEGELSLADHPIQGG